MEDEETNEKPEFVESEDYEKVEAASTSPMKMKAYSSGGTVTGTTTGGWTTYSPAVYPSTATGITWTSGLATAPKPRKAVKLPEKVTKKVLISFLDDDDAPVWAKKLRLTDIKFVGCDQDGYVKMEFSLEDHYGNESGASTT